MHAILLAAILAALPVPAEAELDIAEADVQEVFGRELKAADTDRERVALAETLIETAGGSRPAAKYALLVQARELSIAAGDAAVGVAAVEGLVRGFAPQTPRDAAEWASEGHHLWNLAGHKRPQDRLAAQLEAAECYLRALPDLASLHRTAAEGRLRELGWKAGPIDFNFDEDAEGWVAGNHIDGLKVEGGCLVGRITGRDPYVVCEGLTIAPEDCQAVIVRLSTRWPKDSTFAHGVQLFWATADEPLWSDARYVSATLSNDGHFHCYRFDLARHPHWCDRRITALRVDPGHLNRWAAGPASFSLDYVRGVRVK